MENKTIDIRNCWKSFSPTEESYFNSPFWGEVDVAWLWFWIHLIIRIIRGVLLKLRPYNSSVNSSCMYKIRLAYQIDHLSSFYMSRNTLYLNKWVVWSYNLLWFTLCLDLMYFVQTLWQCLACLHTRFLRQA